MTGAGKSFTTFGNLYNQTNSQEGICILLLRHLIQGGKQTNTTFKFSYLEIYNEQIRDLMCSKSENLMVIEDPCKGVFVPDLTEYQLETENEVKSFILQGNTRRVMASTAANQFSSRSHAIIQINTLRSDNVNQISSKLCIVDLAGSERAAASENRGVRQTEGANINKSLLALGNCINLLSDSNKKGSFVPYRDSKLTRLLKDSLGGNTKSIMIACISGSLMCYDETANTLKYASRARNIKKSVKRNEEEKIEQGVWEYKNIIQELRLEIKNLKDQLAVKNNENLQLINQQKIINQFNSNNSLYCGDNIQEKGSLLDDISQKIFENLEENWEIKMSINEILELNKISEDFIQEMKEKINPIMDQESIGEIHKEILKREQIIISNQEVLQELNSKLIKNQEQKKELQQKMLGITNSFNHYQSQQQFEEKISDNKSFKDLQIQQMTKKMEQMQEELNQKTKQLQDNQEIINNLVKFIFYQ
ncbi:kinesin motor domain protein [Ichthyophthirius multifiliis]|uniref:Kinesin-like protein n=1 Tax=Ichthyophthirius multifiliis TaxID=5932 RepID=G0QPH6_ICHMU|nr:kinesin motor domain protein [Ichthyophthirius multifiliis]EGR32875.1 kinesin motor domain protein [Ichthyophthirius multifiliis]|eukprot:XP_004036861.1 kinesin motor domain protein [Ichthyophthirius multifiliis]